MIKGYAQIEILKADALIKGFTNSRNLMASARALGIQADDEPILEAQLKVKRTLKGKAVGVTAKQKVAEVGSKKSTWKNWQTSMKRELKTMDSKIQTLTASTHRSLRSFDAVPKKFTLTPAFERTPHNKQSVLPELPGKLAVSAKSSRMSSPVYRNFPK